MSSLKSAELCAPPVGNSCRFDKHGFTEEYLPMLHLTITHDAAHYSCLLLFKNPIINVLQHSAGLPRVLSPLEAVSWLIVVLVPIQGSLAILLKVSTESRTFRRCWVVIVTVVPRPRCYLCFCPTFHPRVFIVVAFSLLCSTWSLHETAQSTLLHSSVDLL